MGRALTNITSEPAIRKKLFFGKECYVRYLAVLQHGLNCRCFAAIAAAIFIAFSIVCCSLAASSLIGAILERYAQQERLRESHVEGHPTSSVHRYRSTAGFQKHYAAHEYYRASDTNEAPSAGVGQYQVSAADVANQEV